MSLRRQSASDEDNVSGSEEEFFSDSEASEDLHDGAQSGGRSSPEKESTGRNPGPEQEGVASGQTFPEASSEEEELEEKLRNEGDAELSPSEGSEYSEGGIYGQEDVEEPLTPTGSDGAGSEVDILAERESLEELGLEDSTAAAPHAKVEEAPSASKAEELPQEVPVGKFWLHDDRFSEDASKRRATRPSKKVWDPLDDVKWEHDKFDQALEEDDYEGFLARANRGRGGGRGSYGHRSDSGEYGPVGAGYGQRGRGRAPPGYELFGRHPEFQNGLRGRGRSRGSFRELHEDSQEGEELYSQGSENGRGRRGGLRRGRDSFRGRGDSFRGRDDSFRGRGESFRGRGESFRGRGESFRGRGDSYGDRGRGRSARGRGISHGRAPDQSSLRGTEGANQGSSNGWEAQAEAGSPWTDAEGTQAATWPSLPSRSPQEGPAQQPANFNAAWTQPRDSSASASAPVSNVQTQALEQNSWDCAAAAAQNEGGWSPVKQGGGDWTATSEEWQPQQGSGMTAYAAPAHVDNANGSSGKRQGLIDGGDSWDALITPENTVPAGADGWDALITPENTVPAGADGWDAVTEPAQRAAAAGGGWDDTGHHAEPAREASGWSPVRQSGEQNLGGWGDPGPSQSQFSDGWGAAEESAPATANGWQTGGKDHAQHEAHGDFHHNAGFRSGAAQQAGHSSHAARPAPPHHGSSLNMNAREWAGPVANTPSWQPRTGNLNAGAQDFVPPDQRNGGNKAPQRQFADSRQQHGFRPATPPNVAGMLNQAPDNGAPPNEYLSYGYMPSGDLSVGVLPYDPAYGEAVYPLDGHLGGYVPGPMQQTPQYEVSNWQQYQRSAKRPIAIEAPPERQQGAPQAAEARGGRRYSAMSTLTQNPYQEAS